jgi:chaperone BCS1
MDLNSAMLSSGLVLLLAGSAVALCRKLPVQVWNWFLRRISVTVEIREADESYMWFQSWLAGKMPWARNLSVVTRQNQKKDEECDYSKPTDNRPQSFLTPGTGSHFMWYGGRPVVIQRVKPEGNGGGGVDGVISALGGSAGKNEKFVIRILGRKRSIAEAMISEARDKAIPKDGKIDIRVANVRWGGNWVHADRIRPRPIESVILADNGHEKLIGDISDFRNSYKWYTSLGIPYRRGYLFYGPAGGGKTSLAVALASTFGMNVYVLNLAASGMSDSKLNELMTSVSDNSIVLMEDIDCAFVQREKADKTEETLTFSGVLNALDGVGGKDGRIVIMTTNHIERLDPALVRPGRIDVKTLIGNATPEQARRLFERFYPDQTELAAEFEGSVPDGSVSMAALQGHLMKYKSRPSEAVEQIEEVTGGAQNKGVDNVSGECGSREKENVLGLAVGRERVDGVLSDADDIGLQRTGTNG